MDFVKEPGISLTTLTPVSIIRVVVQFQKKSRNDAKTQRFTAEKQLGAFATLRENSNWASTHNPC